jgi:hypothetical protein
MSAGLTIELPPETLEAIAQRAAEIVLEQLRQEQPPGGRRALYGARAAAEYLGWPVGRVEKLTAANAIPCHRTAERGRVTYLTAELDEWLQERREGPARGLRIA